MKSIVCGMVFGSAILFGGIVAQSQSADMDRDFLMKASQSDFTEIKFSQLAVQKATNARVKAFAQKMVDDHTKLEADMKPSADKLGVAPVIELDSEHQQKYDALNQLSGMDFDKTYMTGMAQDHHIALDLFKTEGKSASDPAMKAVVSKGEKVVAMHTRMADAAVTKMSAMKSPASMGM